MNNMNHTLYKDCFDINVRVRLWVEVWVGINKMHCKCCFANGKRPQPSSQRFSIINLPSTTVWISPVCAQLQGWQQVALCGFLTSLCQTPAGLCPSLWASSICSSLRCGSESDKNIWNRQNNCVSKSQQQNRVELGQSSTVGVLLCVQIFALRQTESSKMQKYATHFIRGISVLMIPIAATVPSVSTGSEHSEHHADYPQLCSLDLSSTNNDGDAGINNSTSRLLLSVCR